MQTSTPQRITFRDGSLEDGMLGSSSKTGATEGPHGLLALAREVPGPPVLRKPVEVAIVEAGCKGLEQLALTPQRATTNRPEDLGPLLASEMRCTHHFNSARIAKLPPEDGRLSDCSLPPLDAPLVCAELPLADVIRALALEIAPEQQVFASEAREISPPNDLQPYNIVVEVGIAGSAFAFCGRFFQC